MAPMHQPQAFFLDSPHGPTFAVLHEPSAPPQALVLHLHAFAEELNKSRRMVAQQARRMAHAGCAVLLIDLPGCGDSVGGLADTGWEAWLDAAVGAATWLQQRHPSAPLWLWGQRVGALLALQAAARLPGPPRLLVWQPVVSGDRALQQFLRLQLAASLQSPTGARSSVDTLRAAWSRGESIEVAGYELGPALARGLMSASFTPPAGVQAGSLLWFEVGSAAQNEAAPALLPASVHALDAFRTAGWSVSERAVAGAAFWQTVEIEEAPELIEATLAALGLDASAAVAAGSAAAPIEHRASSAVVAPNCTEQAIIIRCAGDALVGVLSRPGTGTPEHDTALVVVVGGPQYRVGSHRQFVQLARAAAARGFPVLRFDVRGMGDSSGAMRSFESLDDDLAAAIDTLQQSLPGFRRVVLWGLCDGASASLLYLDRRPDPRVAGLVLLNPWVRSEQSLARTRVNHYYRQRLLQPEFWLKLLRGGVARRALAELAGNLRRARGGPAPTAGYQDRMARAWRRFARPILLVLSGRDYTAREFTEYSAATPAWQGLLTQPGVRRLDAAEADHTFSAVAEQRAMEEATLLWLAAALAPGGQRPSGG